MTENENKWWSRRSGKLLIVGVVLLVVGVVASALPDAFMLSNATLHSWGLPFGTTAVIVFQIVTRAITSLGIALVASAITVMVLEKK